MELSIWKNVFIDISTDVHYAVVCADEFTPYDIFFTFITVAST